VRPTTALLALALALACAGAPPPPSPLPVVPAPVAPAAPSPLRLVLRAGDPAVPGVDASYQPPQVAEPACLLPEISPEAAPPSPGAIVLRFGVAANGAVDDLGVLTNSTGGGAATLAALVDAVKACRWIPARSPQGRRVRVVVVQPFEFVPGE
jgi:hypothetical protein